MSLTATLTLAPFTFTGVTQRNSLSLRKIVGVGTPSRSTVWSGRKFWPKHDTVLPMPPVEGDIETSAGGATNVNSAGEMVGWLYRSSDAARRGGHRLEHGWGDERGRVRVDGFLIVPVGEG